MNQKNHMKNRRKNIPEEQMNLKPEFKKELMRIIKNTKRSKARPLSEIL